MSYFIELAWPLVSLVVAGLVAWRVDRWATARNEVGDRLASLESWRLGLIEETKTLRGRLEFTQTRLGALEELPPRLERVEAALKVPPPLASRDNRERLAAFK